MSGPSDRGSEPPLPDADAPILRFATFNIRHGSDEVGTVRMRMLTRACRELDADVLGLQEVQGGRRRTWYLDQGAVVARATRARHASGPAHHRGLLKTYGNSLVVKGRITDVAVLDLPRAEEREARAAVVARITARGIEVSVAVTHLQHRPKRFAHLRHDAPDQLQRVLDELGERPGPRVLLGDLNLEPDVAGPIFTAAGMTVAEHGPTFPAHQPRRRIDVIAVDGLEIRRAWVADRSPVSDHRAVVAEVAPATRPLGT